MNHAEIRRELCSRFQKLVNNPGQITAKQIRDYQLLLFAAIVSWLSSDDPSHRAYITQATGLGKTVEFSALIQACAGLRSLVIVPTKILVEQTARMIVQFTGGVLGHISSLRQIHDQYGNVIAIRGHEFMDTVVATDESFRFFSDQLAKDFDPHLVIWDECHNAYTRRSKESLDKFNKPVILGFSATPDYLVVENRKDHIPVAMENGQTLYVHPNRMASTHFNKEIHANHVTWGTENGWLCPLAWGQVDFDVNLDEVPLQNTDAGWDYNQGALYDAMADHWPLMIETVISIYKNDDPFKVKDKQAYALCLRVNEAEELAAELNANGISAACLTNKTNHQDRERYIEAYRNKELRFLTSVMVLREGWDAPAAEVCWMLRPTQSRVLYVQAMGRCLRLDDRNPNKVALVIDPLFQGNRHAPLSAPKLFGTPGEEYVSGGILLGKKWRGTRGRQTSPYLPKGVKPRLVVISSTYIEHWAGKDGTFFADGETWGTLEAMGRILGVAPNSVSRRITKACRSRTGRTASGQKSFYCVADVKQACTDLLEDLPQAGKDGTFEADGDIWGTHYSLSTLLGISRGAIVPRLDGCRHRPGRSKSGPTQVFYSLSDVKKACADLLDELPIAGKDGTFEAEGEVWATCYRLAKILKLSRQTIMSRISSAGNIRHVFGKSRSGRKESFYCVADVKKICSDYSEDLPSAGQDGTFEADGETWGTMLALTKRLPQTSLCFISSCTKAPGVRSRRGRNRQGIIKDFFCLADVDKIRNEKRSVRKVRKQST